MENNNNKRWIWLASATVAGLWLWNSTQELIKNISFSFVGVGTGGSFLSPKISVTLSANNPSIGSVIIQTVALQVIYMGNTIGVVTLPQPFTVRANTNTNFTLDMNINDIGTLVTLYKIISSGNTGNEIKLVGSATADGITVPIDLLYSI